MEKSFTDKIGYKSPFSEPIEGEPNPIIRTADKAILQKINKEKQTAEEQAEKTVYFKSVNYTQKQMAALYETDGHYSTVYLICLMLGLDNEFASKLAIATEGPDTTIHSPTKFELNDTWAYYGPQEEIHSLTGGFHGIEEFFTAIKFLHTPNNDMTKLGELLHRFGDTYAHTEINNLRPEDIYENMDLSNADSETIDKYIDSWKIKEEKALKTVVVPWIKFFNYYLKKDGLDFIEDVEKQKRIFNGKTLKEVLKEIYLVNKSKDYIMYGGTLLQKGEHFLTDGSYPDLIYVRPNWYRLYVQNLAWLIAAKYELPLSLLEMNTFDRMIRFVKKECCSMKGIIDYEIAKMLKKNTILVPVYYSDGRLFAIGDSTLHDYLKIAQNVLNYTQIYLKEQGIPENKISIVELCEIKESYSIDYRMNIRKEERKIINAYQITIEK